MKFYHYINLKKEVAKFLARCLDCQQVKVDCKDPSDILQLIMILEYKWEVLSMDSIIGFPRISKQHDSIMVVANQLTKVAHFIPVVSMNSVSEVEKVFIIGIVRFHGVLENIV